MGLGPNLCVHPPYTTSFGTLRGTSGETMIPAESSGLTVQVPNDQTRQPCGVARLREIQPSRRVADWLKDREKEAGEKTKSRRKCDESRLVIKREATLCRSRRKRRQAKAKAKAKEKVKAKVKAKAKEKAGREAVVEEEEEVVVVCVVLLDTTQEEKLEWTKYPFGAEANTPGQPPQEDCFHEPPKEKNTKILREIVDRVGMLHEAAVVFLSEAELRDEQREKGEKIPRVADTLRPREKSLGLHGVRWGQNGHGGAGTAGSGEHRGLSNCEGLNSSKRSSGTGIEDGKEEEVEDEKRCSGRDKGDWKRGEGEKRSEPWREGHTGSSSSTHRVEDETGAGLKKDGSGARIGRQRERDSKYVTQRRREKHGRGVRERGKRGRLDRGARRSIENIVDTVKSGEPPCSHLEPWMIDKTGLGKFSQAVLSEHKRNDPWWYRAIEDTRVGVSRERVREDWQFVEGSSQAPVGLAHSTPFKGPRAPQPPKRSL
ncbi:hypothetical protein WH47_06436 [Habropoda laboriosa]|uniref:Uncharacterized protein n=1 Tax=Habropoda laboriosa TaxID=597456 RepID=A0A0L7RCW2_9HYME|nr:hypothetical protein WH47_06436 [Habropoda laboriosa]